MESNEIDGVFLRHPAQTTPISCKRARKPRYPDRVVRSLRWPCAALLALLAGGCSARPTLTLGNECELATQCAAPLVCRLGHCRDECRLTRDCRAGLVCLRDADGLGACELPQDSCALSSDCAAPLVCVMGRCSVACETDVDCPAGTECVAGTGCRDMSTMGCEYNTDCPDPYICAPDGKCHEQCHTDRDCRDGLVCDHTTFPTVCVQRSDDAGMDATMPSDAAGIDTGLDAGMLPDTGRDAGIDASATTDTGVDSAVDAAMAMTGPAPIPLVVAGSDHVCATRASDGELRCWGANTFGQIGDGSMMQRRVATLVTPTITSVTMLAAGVGHSCAYSTTGGLFCWGDGSSGQVGNGVPGPHLNPILVSGALAPTWIAAGHAHTCATSGGLAYCWGSNASGQIGDGSTMQRNVPTATMPLAAAAVEITARANTTCARLSDGRVQCWGDGMYGQLGIDIPVAPMYSTVPLVVAGVTSAQEVVLGDDFACARRTDGVVLCWGSDGLGQLGDGPGGTARVTPAPTSAMPPAVELAAAAGHACARTMTGDVYCWGDNFGGQGGRDGFATPQLNSPTIVPGVSGATELAAGDNHTCARVAAGIVCWGDNPSGELGDGTLTPHFTPAPVVWL